MLVTQSCPTLCDLIDCSPPGTSVLGILQARILEWSTDPWDHPGIEPGSPALQADSLSHQGSPSKDWTVEKGKHGSHQTQWPQDTSFNILQGLGVRNRMNTQIYVYNFERLLSQTSMLHLNVRKEKKKTKNQTGLRDMTSSSGREACWHVTILSFWSPKHFCVPRVFFFLKPGTTLQIKWHSCRVRVSWVPIKKGTDRTQSSHESSERGLLMSPRC